MNHNNEHVLQVVKVGKNSGDVIEGEVLGSHEGDNSAVEKIRIGSILRRTGCSFSKQDVASFCKITGDTNSIHTSSGSLPATLSSAHTTATSASNQSVAVVVNGALVSSLIPALVGSVFPGSVYLSEALRFRRPVFVGDTLQVALKVLQFSGDKTRLKVHARIAKTSSSSSSSSLSSSSSVLESSTLIDVCGTNTRVEEDLVVIEGEAVALVPKHSHTQTRKDDE